MEKKDIILEVVPEYVLTKRTGSTLVYKTKDGKITTSGDVNKFARQFYSDDIGIYESFFIIITNRASVPIAWMKISQGGISGTVVDVKLIARYAIEHLGSSVILVHNHPSGNLIPSNADINITKKVKNGLETLDIGLLDHIILSPEDDKYFSFADEGIL